MGNNQLKPLNVILLPELVPSASCCLGGILKSLGHNTKVVARYQHRFGFIADEYISNFSRTKLRRFIDHIWASRYLFQNWDIVHFNYGSTLFDPRFTPSQQQLDLKWKLRQNLLKNLQKLEIWILKKRKIPIFVHFQGDDAVQGDVSLKIFHDSIAHHVNDTYYSPASDNEKRTRISWFDTFASEIFAVSPDMMWFLPKRTRFIPYVCTNLLELAPDYPSKLPDKIRICHAPTDRSGKGTPYIEEAVKQLILEGYIFEFKTLENMEHARVIDEIRNSDLFIDQIHHGWYGGVAVEAMALGKPVMAFIRQGDLVHIPKAMADEIPILMVEYTTILSNLRNLLSSDRINFRDLGLKSRAYVEAWHNPTTVVSEIINLYKIAHRGS